MRRLVLIALLLAAPPARAAVLTSASLALEQLSFPMPPLVFSAAGASGSAGGPTLAVLGAGSAFAGTLTASFPSSSNPPVSAVVFWVGPNAQGLFTGPTPGALHGAMPVWAGMCLYGYGGICLLGASLPIGAPVVTHAVASGIYVTAIGNGWTAGSTTVALPSPTSQGGTTAMRAGGNGLDGLGRGTVVLVSGFNVLSNITSPVPGFATLTLNYVPEPGALVLLGSAAALALSGRVRRRRGRP